MNYDNALRASENNHRVRMLGKRFWIKGRGSYSNSITGPVYNILIPNADGSNTMLGFTTLNVATSELTQSKNWIIDDEEVSPIVDEADFTVYFEIIHREYQYLKGEVRKRRHTDADLYTAIKRSIATFKDLSESNVDTLNKLCECLDYCAESDGEMKCETCPYFVEFDEVCNSLVEIAYRLEIEIKEKETV